MGLNSSIAAKLARLDKIMGARKPSTSTTSGGPLQTATVLEITQVHGTLLMWIFQCFLFLLLEKRTRLLIISFSGHPL